MTTIAAAWPSSRALTRSLDDQALRVGRLSSGLRLHRAADDASGLAISERLRAQVTGSAVAARNVHEAINLLATAEGGLSGVADALQRAREVAVAAASTGSGTAADREAQAEELRHLVAEVDRIAGASAYNGMRLLDGSRTDGFAFQVGAASGQAMRSVLGDVRASTLGLTGSGGASTATAASLEVATTSSTPVVHHAATSTSFTTYDPRRSRGWDFTVGGVRVATVSIAGGSYTAAQLAGLLRAGLGSDPPVSIAVLAGDTPGTSRLQVTASDAGGGPTQAVTVDVGGSDKLVFTTTASTQQSAGTAPAEQPVAPSDPGTTVDTSTGTSLVDLVRAGDGAAIALLDEALSRVLAARTEIGATANRLHHRLGSLASAQDDLGAARSRIADADVAREYTALVRAQVMGSAGLALQAQQAPSARRVLRLLEGL